MRYDNVGRPVQAYDEKGNIVWLADYDIYGKMSSPHGVSFCEFFDL